MTILERTSKLGHMLYTGEFGHSFHLAYYAHFQCSFLLIICSCAFKFQSEMTSNQKTDLFDQLSSVEISTSENMLTTLILRQDGKEIPATSRRSQMLIEPLNSSYHICVPRQASDRRSCFRSKLPKKVMAILGISDQVALHTISRLLNESLEDLDEVMLELNVPPVAWIDRPSHFSSRESSKDNEVQRSTPTAVSNPTSGSQRTSGNLDSIAVTSLSTQTPSPPSLSTVPLWTRQTAPAHTRANSSPFFKETLEVLTQPASQSHLSSTHLSVPKSITRRRSAGNFVRPNVGSWHETYSEGPSNFCLLLSQVIELASRADIGNLPALQGSNSVFDLTSVMQTLPLRGTLLPVRADMESIFGPPGLPRDFRIGAAGQLYVFERLKKLGLPGFTWDNWYSRIRKEVKVHPSYAFLPTFDERETADLIYTDTSGSLARFLQSKCNGTFPDIPGIVDGHDQQSTTYYLKVKSTTLPTPDEKFYVSKNEYDLMRRCALEPDQRVKPKEIHVILRVYNLLSEEIGMNIFVDPCRFERNGKLKFEVNGYHVYPQTSGA